MLLEELVNRYRNPWVAPIRFPSVMLPVLIIIGAFLAFVFMPFVILMFVLDVLPELFTPKLTLVSALVGSGLVLAPLSIGAIYGQVLEKRTGYVRSGYEAKIMLYLFILGISLPFPAYYGFKFFYNYPFARYPSYILEVKPSPELKEEIERFGLAEIKWHTPYDYSLDRQVIRYDFGEPIDGDWTSYESKRSIFEEVASQRNSQYISTFKDRYDYTSLDLDGVRYPMVIATDEGVLNCVIALPLKYDLEISGFRYEAEGKLRELPVLELAKAEKTKNLVYLDVSSVFDYYHPETVMGYEQDKLVCSLYGGSLDYLYIASKLLMPRLQKSVFSFSKKTKVALAFGVDQFLIAVRSL